jgi:SAM-dependent methyltransferase
MFAKTAQFYDALYHFKDYVSASRQLDALIRQINPRVKHLLDVGCGTGKHIEYLREYYQAEGLDLSPEMLEIARERFPEVPFHLGDMVDFDLGRAFDVVTCLFGSIGYLKTVESLDRAVARMASHLRPGGILVVEPWLSPENYWVGRLTANVADQPDLKIAWMYISEMEGRLSIFDIHYLVGTPQGISSFVERQEMGLFTHEEYLEAFQKAGLEVSYDPKGLFGYGMYTGVRK